MTSLFVDRKGVEVEMESGALVFREAGERVSTVPSAPIERIFLRGDVRLSASVLGCCGAQGIGVVVLSGRQGRPSLMLPRAHNDASRRLRQARCALDASFCLEQSRIWVAAKLEAQQANLHAWRESDASSRYSLTGILRTFDGMKATLAKAETLDTLRGIEGAAARSYFQGLATQLPPSFGFNGRNRRPPRDPFNALISLCYTIVHAETAIALHGVGLDPAIGFYHKLSFGRESLACDLLEPLRPMVDALCLGMVRNRQLEAHHFSTTKTGCLLGKAGRGHFYGAYERAAAPLRTELSAQVKALLERVGSDDGLDGIQEADLQDDEW